MSSLPAFNPKVSKQVFLIFYSDAIKKTQCHLGYSGVEKEENRKDTVDLFCHNFNSENTPHRDPEHEDAEDKGKGKN